MPFQSAKQAKLMRAVAHGFKPDQFKGPPKSVAKKFVAEDKAHPSGYASGGTAVNYARGGPVLGRERDFTKESDEFRDEGTPKEHKHQPPPLGTDPGYDWDQSYAKSGPQKGGGYSPVPPQKMSKVLPTVKPRE